MGFTRRVVGVAFSHAQYELSKTEAIAARRAPRDPVESSAPRWFDRHIPMATATIDDFRRLHARSIARLSERGGAARLAVDAEMVCAALYASVRSWAGGLATEPDERATSSYLDGLNAEDLVLACACRAGGARAWEEFVVRFRGAMNAAARALMHDDVRARELADSLYAELYGLEERAGERRSLLAYYHGRGSLGAWLRAVIAQRHTDAHRRQTRAQMLGEAIAREAGAGPAGAIDPPDPDRARYLEAIGAAMRAAIAELAARDRLRLNLYYAEELTLKQVGRAMREHESGVSRHLARTREDLRRRAERRLKREYRLNDEQIRLCYVYAIEEWPAELGRLLPGAYRGEAQ